MEVGCGHLVTILALSTGLNKTVDSAHYVGVVLEDSLCGVLAKEKAGELL